MDEERKKLRVYGVDVDGTLTNETCWNNDDCLNATPKQKVIDHVNELFENNNYILIYTARKHSLYEATVKWLNKHNVHYHAIRMGKLPADIYIDDKMINPNEL